MFIPVWVVHIIVTILFFGIWYWWAGDEENFGGYPSIIPLLKLSIVAFVCALYWIIVLIVMYIRKG